MQVTWALDEQCFGNQTAPMSVLNREREAGSLHCMGVEWCAWFSLSDDCKKTEQPPHPTSAAQSALQGHWYATRKLCASDISPQLADSGTIAALSPESHIP